MTSKTEIANGAFTLIGVEPVTNVIDDQGDAAVTFRTQFDIARLEVLRASSWRFAMRSALLNQATDTPGIDFTATYQLPSSPKCLLVVRTNLHTNEGYAVFGDKLHANQQPTIEYIADVGVEYFDPTAVSALMHLLASRLALPMGGSRTTRDSLFSFYKDILSEARQSNEHERGKRDNYYGSLRHARRSTLAGASRVR